MVPRIRLLLGIRHSLGRNGKPHATGGGSRGDGGSSSTSNTHRAPKLRRYACRRLGHHRNTGRCALNSTHDTCTSSSSSNSSSSSA